MQANGNPPWGLGIRYYTFTLPFYWRQNQVSVTFRPGLHGCKNFASALQRPRPLRLKIWQRGHAHVFIEAPSARCSKFGKLSNVFMRRECSLPPPPPKKKKRKKGKNNRLTSHSFSYCWRCSQCFFFSSAVAVQEAGLRTSTLKVIVFLHQPQNKNKKILKKKTCSTTRKGPHAPIEKVLFSKRKKKKTKTWRPRIPSHIASAAACAFSFAAAAREAALRAASRCSFKILLQYPWKLQRSAYQKPNLTAVWPGP